MRYQLTPIHCRPWLLNGLSTRLMAGATWRDPDLVQEWSGELSKSDPVVVFCVYGCHVGCKTAIMLREAGFDAKYMKGGHSAWKAFGGAMKPIAEERPAVEG